MSTRGLYGFIEDGEYYGNYNHSDSYPSGLGLEFWTACKNGDLSGYGLYENTSQDNINFIKDSLFCEWAYFYDKDNRIFEIWQGFQKQPDPTNPFGQNCDEQGYYPCKRIYRGKINSLNEKVFVDRGDFDSFITSYNRDIKINKIIEK